MFCFGAARFVAKTLPSFLQYRLRNVDDKIPHALQFRHDVHVIHACLVVVAGTLNIVDMLVAKLVAQHVDPGFGVFRIIDVL